MHAHRNDGGNGRRGLGLAALILFGGARTTLAQQLLASGGDEAYVTNLNGTVYGIHIYTNVGAHSFTPHVPIEIEYLVVGGGGGGSTAGGGAGGVVTGTTSLSSSPYSITVGAGGSGVRGDATPRPVPASNGTNSTAFGITALGGGGGGGTDNKGMDGGSGGGAAASSVPANPSNGGAGLQPASASGGLGNAGGSVSSFSSPYTAAGGGGAGAQGQNQQSSTQAGKGGDGIESAITGDAIYYGGGGGGGFWQSPGVAAAGGLGGGGSGVTSANGDAGTGGGGGGGRQTTKGGNGGSGIVIVRYSALDPNAPTIQNQPVTSVTAGSATFNGLLVSTGSSASAVCVYWGTDTNAWAYTNWFNDGAVNSDWTDNTPFGTNIASGISPDTTYYYSYGASNATTNVVASKPIFFITGDVWIEKTVDASEIGPTPGTFTVCRAGAVTNEAITVAYAVGGTATPGVDYAALSGTVTLEAGETNAVIAVAALFDHLVEGPETVEVTLLPGPYAIGSESNATLEIADYGLVTRTWGGAGVNAFASNPTNWVEGEAPIAGDAIVLDDRTNKNMTWNLAIPVQSWTQIGYTGTVTIATVYPGQGAFTNLAILGDCVISNGVWTQTANPSGAIGVRRLRATIGGNLAVGSEAAIDVTGKGFLKGQGRGTGGSASHGGRGGYSIYGASGPCYGSIAAPTDLGSGGHASYGTTGGGAIRMEVRGSIAHDGLIAADGQNGSYHTAAGGSIWVSAASLSGVGTIRANGGGVLTTYNTGGGGRIALILQEEGAEFQDFTGAVNAYGGANGSSRGTAGTIYRETAKDIPGKGELILNNAGSQIWYGDRNTDLNGAEAVTSEFRRITLTNGAVLHIGPDDTLIVTNTILSGAGAAAGNGIWISGGELRTAPVFAFSNMYVGIAAANSSFNPGIALTVGTNAEFRVDKPHTMAGDVKIAAGGLLTHTANPSANTEFYKIDLSLDGSMTVEEGGLVNVTGRGYPVNYGPGTPLAGNAGVSHGGLGVGGLACYGSLVAPTNLGSGGRSGGAGGGAIRLAVSGVVSNRGGILANAAIVTANTGAGGSIFITAGALTGDGPIQANSATNVTGDRPGGGGRVAVAVTHAGENVFAYAGPITAYGGRKPASTSGGAGTVYVRNPGQGVDEGTLIVDNNNLAGLGTEISSNVTDTTVAHVRIQRKGNLQLAENQALTVSGVWSNSASFMGLTDSAVIFTGGAGATSTICGATTFKGLVCADAGHTLAFEAGSTNGVAAYGRLILRGAAATNLILRSTVDNTAWKLNVDALAEQDVEFVDVKDSDAGGGATVIAKNSVGEDQQNDNWTFMVVTPGETITWTGNGNTLWGAAENWDLVRAPVETDVIVIPGGRANYPVFDAHRTANRLTIQSGGSVFLNGFDLTVTNATVMAGALNAAGLETVTFRGDVDFTGGAVAPAFSTLVLAGNVAQSVNLGGLTFYKVRAENSADTVMLSGGFTATELRCEALSGMKSLAFEAGKTVTLRDLVVRGASPGATNIVLASATPGSKWNLAVSGYRSVRGVSVSNSDARPGLPIPALDSKNDGGNENWTFGAAPAQWLGTSGNNFHTPANWDPAVVPDGSTRVLVESANAMTITGTVYVLDLTVGGGGNAVSVTVNGELTVGESVVLLGQGTLAWNRPGVVSNDLVVAAGGVLTHTGNSSTEANRQVLTVHGDVGIDPQGRVDVTGKGYTKGNGPGTGASASHGGRGGYTIYGPSGPCYGSILMPTNAGSGGHASYGTSGGGVVVWKVAGILRNDGGIYANAEDGSYHTGAGGSIFLTAGALCGIGPMQARGGEGGYNNGGGGRISLVVTNRDAAFANYEGAVLVRSGVNMPAATSAGGGGAGTVYWQTAADRAGRGTVWLGNENYPATGPADVPSEQGAVAGETAQTVFHVANAARLRLTNDFTVGDIWLDTANAVLDLGSNTLTVNAREHDLGLGAVLNRGDIIWKGLPPGALIMIK